MDSRRQRGVALVSVMLVFALAALLAMQLQRASTQDIRQMSANVATSQARWYARGGEALGRQLLARDWQDDKRLNDHSDGVMDEWNKALSFPLDEGEINIKINDLSGLVNLNGLDWAQQDAQVGGVFVQLGVPVSAVSKLRTFYRQQNADGSTPQLLHMEQLREVAGLSLQQVKVLSPYFSALEIPADAADSAGINANTISPELMLLLGMARSEVNNIARRQKYKKYRTKDPPPGSFPGAISSNIRVYSEYFEILVAASHGGRNAYLRSVVYRDKAGKLLVLQRTSSKSAVRELLQQRGWQ
jgi:general secretion pathway protein K